MKFTITKQPNGKLVPAFEKDQDMTRKLKVGGLYQCEVKQPRNYGFHCKLFVMLDILYKTLPDEMQEAFKDTDGLRYFLTMKAGYYKEIETPKGKFHLPDSISFAKMTEDVFQDLYEKIMMKVWEIFDIDVEGLSEQVEESMAPNQQRA